MDPKREWDGWSFADIANPAKGEDGYPRLQVENRVYCSRAFRKLHLEVATRQDGLEVLHMVLFPRCGAACPLLSGACQASNEVDAHTATPTPSVTTKPKPTPTHGRHSRQVRLRPAHPGAGLGHRGRYSDASCCGRVSPVAQPVAAAPLHADNGGAAGAPSYITGEGRTQGKRAALSGGQRSCERCTHAPPPPIGGVLGRACEEPLHPGLGQGHLQPPCRVHAPHQRRGHRRLHQVLCRTHARAPHGVCARAMRAPVCVYVLRHCVWVRAAIARV